MKRNGWSEKETASRRGIEEGGGEGKREEGERREGGPRFSFLSASTADKGHCGGSYCGGLTYARVYAYVESRYGCARASASARPIANVLIAPSWNPGWPMGDGVAYLYTGGNDRYGFLSFPFFFFFFGLLINVVASTSQVILSSDYFWRFLNMNWDFFKWKILWFFERGDWQTKRMLFFCMYTSTKYTCDWCTRVFDALAISFSN